MEVANGEESSDFVLSIIGYRVGVYDAVLFVGDYAVFFMLGGAWMNGGKLKYLQELMYGDMEDSKAAAGFIEHYVLGDKSLNNLYSDVCLLSCATAGKEANKKITEGLKNLLESFSPKAPEGELSFAEMLGE